jgi:hypothetical protein
MFGNIKANAIWDSQLAHAVPQRVRLNSQQGRGPPEPLYSAVCKTEYMGDVSAQHRIQSQVRDTER